MPLKRLPWQWIAIAVFAIFALNVAAEPFMDSPDDCISAFDILVLLPYYALLYFGTLPALVGVAAWRIAFARRMSARSRRGLNVTIGALGVLLVLEVLGVVESPYMSLAGRSLDFIPAVVLAIWLFVRIWPYVRAPQGAHS